MFTVNKTIPFPLACIASICMIVSCSRTQIDNRTYTCLSLSTNDPDCFTSEDIANINAASLRIGLHKTDSILSYDTALSLESLNISEDLLTYIIDLVRLVNNTTLTKSGADSLDVSGIPPGDCVITALKEWGDYTYAEIAQIAADSCYYSYANGIHISEISHLLNILYPNGYDELASLPFEYSEPINTVAVMLYHDPQANIYRTHMVNVSINYFGLAIGYEGGTATIENCIAIYQKR